MKKINRGYDLVDGKWIDLGFEEVVKTKEQTDQDTINQLRIEQSQITKYLAETDIKVTKYRDQLELVNMNLLESTDITQDEFEDMLIDRQNKRNQYRSLEQQIYDIENPQLNTEEATPYEEI